MKRFGHLFERIVTFENLRKATLKAARGKRSKSTVARFLIDYEREIIDLQAQLMAGTYQPKPYFKFTIFEPKERSICSSEFEDRVLHHAICNVIEPFFERRLISDTYACRVGKGAHLALARCQQFARRYPFFLKLDIAKYFDSVDHAVLKRLLTQIFKDEKLLSLLGQIVDHTVPGAISGKGLPIGNLTSQHFANLYLGELDHFGVRNEFYANERFFSRIMVPAVLKCRDNINVDPVRIFMNSKRLVAALKSGVSKSIEQCLMKLVFERCKSQ